MANSDSDGDDNIFLLASQIYEESVVKSATRCSSGSDRDVDDDQPRQEEPSYDEQVDEEYPPEKYRNMGQDDFLYDNLLPEEFHEFDRKESGGSVESVCRPIEEPSAHGQKISAGSSDGRFAVPVTEKDILDKIEGRTPRSTRRVTEWAVKNGGRIENSLVQRFLLNLMALIMNS